MPHYEIHAFSTYVRYGLFFDPPLVHLLFVQCDTPS